MIAVNKSSKRQTMPFSRPTKNSTHAVILVSLCAASISGRHITEHMRVLTRGWSPSEAGAVRDIQWLSGDHCRPGPPGPSLIYDQSNDHRGISHLITSDQANITQPQIASLKSMDDSIINNRQVKSDQFPTLSDVLVTAISRAGDHSSIFYQFHHRLAHSQLYWRDTEDGSVDIIALRAVQNVSVGRLLFSKHPVWEGSRGREASRGERQDLVTNKWEGALIPHSAPT